MPEQPAIPLMNDQVAFWNEWNRQAREERPPDVPTVRRQQEVLQTLGTSGLRAARLLEVGCGTGWLSTRLLDFGDVTATDLADDSNRARPHEPSRHPVPSRRLHDT